MALYLGIDLGTSGLKAVFIDEAGTIVASGYRGYGIDIPQPGYAEQDPQVWWASLCAAVREALKSGAVAPRAVAGIGFSGQMHSTVLLDANARVLRPAILWCDQRATGEARRIRESVGAERLGRWVQNTVHTGFQASTLCWVRKWEPALFKQARHALLPKDYLRLRMTGEIGTDATDAASTLLFDCAHFCWSAPLLDALDIAPSILPARVGMPSDVAGFLTAEAAAETGLCAGTPVVFGGGDQPMQAVGNGIFHPGTASLTLGTGGQILLPMESARYDPLLRTHTFCHALPGRWYAMGATLSACLSLNWFLDRVLSGPDLALANEEAARVAPGSDGLVFLPYLTGERTPHMDPLARGAFFGLQLSHSRATMIRAVLEGVAYSLRDALDVLTQLNLGVERIVLAGGGVKSALWVQILADVLERPLYATRMREEASVGAAICAMVGTGAYPTLAQACSRIVRLEERPVLPCDANLCVYRDRLHTFRTLYTRTSDLNHT